MLFGQLFNRLAVATTLAVSVSGAAIERRGTQDMQAMSQAFDKIFAKIDATVANIASYNGQAATLQAVQDANAGIREAVELGTKIVKGSPNMDFFSIIHIGGPLMVMEGKISELMEAFKSKKPEVAATSGAKLVIYNELKKDKASVDVFVDSIMKNLPFPEFIGIIARPIGQMVIKKLADGMAEWATT